MRASCRSVADRAGAFAGLCALSFAFVACNDPPPQRSEPPAIEASPNASILPAPLASDVETRRAAPARSAMPPLLDAGASELGAPPRALREDVQLPVDPLRPEPGVRLSARFSWLDLPPFPRLPELNAEASHRLRDSLAFALTLDLSPQGRLRAVLGSDAFLLPRGSELRSRLEYLGHVLLWESGMQYTLLPAGTLRAVLTEHRADAAPLVEPRLTNAGNGRLLGLSTERTELATPLGRLVLEQAALPGIGASGMLVCRLLGELITAQPTHAGCSAAKVPLRAELFSTGGGHLLFEVQRIDRDQSLEEASLTTTPAGARLVKGELPAAGPSVVVAKSKLAELRTRAAPRDEKPDPSAPKAGLLLQNKSESLRYVLLDGVVVARVMPHSEIHVDGLLPGKYGLVTLDFLGDDPTPLRIVALPARVALGDDVEVSH
jgi:hypothetical protein